MTTILASDTGWAGQIVLAIIVILCAGWLLKKTTGWQILKKIWDKLPRPNLTGGKIGQATKNVGATALTIVALGVALVFARAFLNQHPRIVTSFEVHSWAVWLVSGLGILVLLLLVCASWGWMSGERAGKWVAGLAVLAGIVFLCSGYFWEWADKSIRLNPGTQRWLDQNPRTSAGRAQKTVSHSQRPSRTGQGKRGNALQGYPYPERLANSPTARDAVTGGQDIFHGRVVLEPGESKVMAIPYHWTGGRLRISPEVGRVAYQVFGDNPRALESQALPVRDDPKGWNWDWGRKSGHKEPEVVDRWRRRYLFIRKDGECVETLNPDPVIDPRTSFSHPEFVRLYNPNIQVEYDPDGKGVWKTATKPVTVWFVEDG